MQHSKIFDTKIINKYGNPFMIHEQEQSSTKEKKRCRWKDKMKENEERTSPT